MNLAPTLAGLAAYAGAYEKQLFSTLVNALDAVTDLTVYLNVKNKLNLTKLKAGKGARPYSVSTTARPGDLKYTGRVLEVSMGKRDMEIEPMQYRDTWQSEVMKPGVNADDIPFEGYVMDQIVTEFAAEINDKTVYFGFDKSLAAAFDTGKAYSPGEYMLFNAADGFTDYYLCLTSTTANQTPVSHAVKWQEVNAEAITVGFAVRIAYAISNEGLVPVVTGAISNTNAVAKVELVARSMPVAFQKAGFTVFISYDVWWKYQDDYRERYGKQIQINKDGFFDIDAFAGKVKLKPCTWMGASQRIIATPKENLIIGTDQLSDANKIDSFVKLRTMELGINLDICTQIRDLEAIKVNDQA